jgi:hypothetical protein
MQTAGRRRTTWAIAASVLAHACVLAADLLQHYALPLPAYHAEGPPEPIIPILLMPRMPPAAAGSAAPSGELRLHRRRLRADDSPLPLAPLPAPAAPARPAEPRPEATAPAPAPQTSLAGPPAADLRAALRHGVVGCANGGASLTRAEREHCEEQLGRGVAEAPFLPAAIPARIRTYYDAVARAKAPDGPLTPQRAPGALGPMDEDARGSNGHPPGIGCAIPFGAGKKATHKQMLPHALWLGPCFIEPPKGSLTPEVDIAPP